MPSLPIRHAGVRLLLAVLAIALLAVPADAWEQRAGMLTVPEYGFAIDAPGRDWLWQPAQSSGLARWEAREPGGASMISVEVNARTRAVALDRSTVPALIAREERNAASFGRIVRRVPARERSQPVPGTWSYGFGVDYSQTGTEALASVHQFIAGGYHISISTFATSGSSDVTMEPGNLYRSVTSFRLSGIGGMSTPEPAANAAPTTPGDPDGEFLDRLASDQGSSGVAAGETPEFDGSFGAQQLSVDNLQQRSGEDGLMFNADGSFSSLMILIVYGGAFVLAFYVGKAINSLRLAPGFIASMGVALAYAARVGVEGGLPGDLSNGDGTHEPVAVGLLVLAGLIATVMHWRVERQTRRERAARRAAVPASAFSGPPGMGVAAGYSGPEGMMPVPGHGMRSHQQRQEPGVSSAPQASAHDPVHNPPPGPARPAMAQPDGIGSQPDQPGAAGHDAGLRGHRQAAPDDGGGDDITRRLNADPRRS